MCGLGEWFCPVGCGVWFGGVVSSGRLWSVVFGEWFRPVGCGVWFWGVVSSSRLWSVVLGSGFFR